MLTTLTIACFVAAALLAVTPRVQFVQMVLPASAAVVPFGQGVHVALLVREGTKPALQ
jgi:membrane protein YqaA with SNARE-associated domain